MRQNVSGLPDYIKQELSEPVPEEVSRFVQSLVKQGNPLAVIFYGSGLRGGIQDDTLLDFYIVLNRQADWPRSFLARSGNAILPPNVEYHEIPVAGRMLRAKVAFVTLAQLRYQTGFSTLDTTVWARFSQPVRLVWVRDKEAESAVCTCIARAVVTASRWAAFMGPVHGGDALSFWKALYQKTYQTELRVEKASRGAGIVETYPRRYTELLVPCWEAAGVKFTQAGEGLLPCFSAQERHKLEQKWRLRTAFGKPLNIARLIKAAFTFTGGARYAAWKIERHSGIKVPLTPFMEKHPLICGVPLLIRLWQKGAFQRNVRS